MNIIMIGPFPQDSQHINGGVQASVYGLCKTLTLSKEMNISGISLPTHADRSFRAKPDRMMVDDIPVLAINAPYGLLSSNLVHLPCVLNHIQQTSQPLVHLHGTGLMQWALMALLRVKKIPFVWTLHGITERETQQQWKASPNLKRYMRHHFYRVMERAMLRLSKHTIVDTPYVRDALQTIAAQPLHVIPQGIFLNEFVGMADERSLVAPLILSIGVIDARKGHHHTIDAFAQLRANHPNAQLIIAGAMKNEVYYQQLQQQIAELKAQDMIQIRTNCTRLEILQLLVHATLFALHSREESQGIAICEAMAAGVPVIATRVGGIPDVVRDGTDGILVAYGDSTAFAQAIQSLLSDPQAYESFSSSAHTQAKRFDWGSITPRICAVYAAARSA